MLITNLITYDIVNKNNYLFYAIIIAVFKKKSYFKRCRLH